MFIIHSFATYFSLYLCFFLFCFYNVVSVISCQGLWLNWFGRFHLFINSLAVAATQPCQMQTHIREKKIQALSHHGGCRQSNWYWHLCLEGNLTYKGKSFYLVAWILAEAGQYNSTACHSVAGALQPKQSILIWFSDEEEKNENKIKSTVRAILTEEYNLKAPTLMHSCCSIVNAWPLCKGASASKKSAAPAKTASGCQRELILWEHWHGPSSRYLGCSDFIILTPRRTHFSLFFVVVVVVKVDHWG